LFYIRQAGIRYEVKGKLHLKSLEKYYFVDVGLRRMLLGDKNADIGPVLENIEYLELLRRGYTVDIDKVDDKEIDFIAMTGGDRIYYQIAASILDPAAFAREIAPLKKVSDHYPKFICATNNVQITAQSSLIT